MSEPTQPPCDTSLSRSSPSYKGFTSTSAAASATKRRNRSRDTKPEKLLRSSLWILGARYRLHFTGLPGRPDIVFARARVAVFCDGDFWHGREWRRRRARLVRGANPQYWIPKILANRRRDRQITQALRQTGWLVIRVWETEVRKDPDAAARTILGLVAARLEELVGLS